jgi:hypothetical protein
VDEVDPDSRPNNRKPKEDDQRTIKIVSAAQRSALALQPTRGFENPLETDNRLGVDHRLTDPFLASFRAANFMVPFAVDSGLR